jgi:hypothetical protein
VSNALFDHGRDAFLNAAVNWGSDTIKVALVNTSTYTVNLSTHQFFSDLSGVVGTPVALSSKSSSAGVANAATATFSAVTGSAAGALVIYKDTGTTTTSPLIAYIDSATGLPVTPNGGDISITWDTGSNKVFKL